MTAAQRRHERARILGLDRLHIFVPAVMSVGLFFWMASELVELFRARTEQVREERSRVAGAEVVDQLLNRTDERSPSEQGLRPRPVYVMIGLTLVGVALYVLVGSIANYVRPGGYVSNIAWLLALAASGRAYRDHLRRHRIVGRAALAGADGVDQGQRDPDATRNRASRRGTGRTPAVVATLRRSRGCRRRCRDDHPHRGMVAPHRRQPRRRSG